MNCSLPLPLILSYQLNLISQEMEQEHFPWYGAGAPITLAGVTTNLDLTVSSLLHKVDIVLGINWLKTVNPIIDWCSGRVYLPGAIHTAVLEGTWLSADNTIGTIKLY